jgi:hypothetical protein
MAVFLVRNFPYQSQGKWRQNEFDVTSRTIESKLIPQLARKPTGTPLATVLKAQLAQPNADRIDIVSRHRVRWKQCHLTRQH